MHIWHICFRLEIINEHNDMADNVHPYQIFNCCDCIFLSREL